MTFVIYDYDYLQLLSSAPLIIPQKTISDTISNSKTVWNLYTTFLVELDLNKFFSLNSSEKLSAGRDTARELKSCK